MTRTEVTQQIIAARIRKGVKWKQLADLVGLSLPWTISACLGQNRFTAEEAAKVGDALDLNEDAVRLLQVPANRAEGVDPVPTDPLVYRLHEIVLCYGTTLKEVIHEEFGDGIMSAIDFNMSVERLSDPKGDRVKIVLDGKFLPYKKF